MMCVLFFLFMFLVFFFLHAGETNGDRAETNHEPASIF